MVYKRVLCWFVGIFFISIGNLVWAAPTIKNYTCPSLHGGILQDEIVDDRWQAKLSYGSVSKISGPPWIDVNIDCSGKKGFCKLECFFMINQSDKGSIVKYVAANTCVISDDKFLGEFSCSR